MRKLAVLLGLLVCICTAGIAAARSHHHEISSHHWVGAGSDPVLLGSTSVQPVSDGGTNSSEAFGYTATTSGTATDAEVYLTSTSGVRIGLYADSNSKPGARLDQGSVTSNVRGWVDVSLNVGVQITKGTRYWLAIAANSGKTVTYKDVGASGSTFDWQLNGLANPASLVHQWNSNPASVYLNGTTAPPPPSPPTAVFTITPNPVVAEQAATFNGGSSICNATPCSYSWTDPSDGQSYSSAASFSYTFNSVSMHQMKLTVTDSLGQANSSTQSFQVQAASPPPPPNPLPPSNTTSPSIGGTPQSGQTLTASPGTWTGDTPMTFSYQWSDGTTGPTDLLNDSEVGTSVFVTVTASNDATPPTVSASSSSVGPIIAASGGGGGPCTDQVSCWPNASNTGYQNAPGYPGTPGVADPTKLTTASASSSTCPLTFQSNHTYSFCRYTGGMDIGSQSGTVSNVHFIGDLFENGNHTTGPGWDTWHLFCSSSCTFDYITMKPLINAPDIPGRHGTTYANSYGLICECGAGAYNSQGHGLQLTHSDIWGYDSGLILGPNTAATPILIQDNWFHDQGDCIHDQSNCSSHADGIGMVDTGSSSSYVTIDHNNMPFIQDNTNDLAFQSGTYDHLTVTNNLFSGDGYTIAIWATSSNITFTGNVYTNYAQNWFGMNYGQDFWDTPGSTWAHNKFLWDPDPLSVQGTYFEEGPQNGNVGPITSADSGKCWVPDGLSTTDYHGGTC